MWEKEKLLISSNFFFSHSVFKRLVMQTHKNQGLFGKGLKHILANTEISEDKLIIFSKNFLFRVLKTRDCFGYDKIRFA